MTDNSWPDVEFSHKKVAIVGANKLTRDNAPFDDPTFEIWSMSDWICSAWLKRCDLLLEIHQPGQYMNHPRTKDYWQKLQTLDIPVYMYPLADPRVPKSVLYPKDGVLEMLSGGKNMGKDFKPLNSSVAYLIALAIFKEYEQIDVYGVELAHSSEYMSQQPIFAFWDGFALGRGCVLNVNCSNGLFNQPLYGLEDNLEKTKIFGMMKAFHAEFEKAKESQLRYEGGMRALRTLINTRDVYK